MKNKLWISVIAILLLTSVDSFGQRWKLRRYEMDIYIAGVAFHGDIGKANQPFANMFNGFRPSFGVTPRFYILQDLSVSVDLSYTMYGGKDDEDSSHGRYFSFTSHGFVHGLRTEYFILGTRGPSISGAVYNRRGMINNYNRLYLYAYGGVSGILSKSNIKYADTGENIPEDTPGYNNNLVYSVVFPVGVGAKLSLDPRWSVGVEFGYNFSLSDYLDGYASEWSEYNDSYYTISVKAILKIRNDRNGRPVLKKLYR